MLFWSTRYCFGPKAQELGGLKRKLLCFWAICWDLDLSWVGGLVPPNDGLSSRESVSFLFHVHTKYLNLSQALPWAMKRPQKRKQVTSFVLPPAWKTSFKDMLFSHWITPVVRFPATIFFTWLSSWKCWFWGLLFCPQDFAYQVTNELCLLALKTYIMPQRTWPHLT